MRNEIKKNFKFEKVGKGDIFTLRDENGLFMKIKEQILYEPCGDYQAYNAVNLETLEIEEISGCTNVIVFEKSFLTVE